MDSHAPQIISENPPHDRARHGVYLELVETLAEPGLSGIGMSTRIGEPVAVGRTTTKIAALDRCLCRHGGSDADLDPVALALAHPSVQRHDEFVGVGAWVDPSSDFGHP